MADDTGTVPFGLRSDGVEVRHLRAFVAVAGELNFSRAADLMYVSQPALSRQIRTLERALGVQLLHRSTRSVELTPAGEALLERARAVLGDLDAAISAARAVGGELDARIMRLWAPMLDAVAAEASVASLREQFEAFLAQADVPPAVSVRPVNAHGVPALIAGDHPSVLYLHGGNYILGSAYGYRPLAGALAQAAGVGVVIADYRLAPEHPLPAAIDDARDAYRWLVTQSGGPPQRITLAGDSSGAGLALAVLLALRADDEPMPAGAVLLSPAVDLTGARLAPPTGPDVMDDIWEAAQHALGADGLRDQLVCPLDADLTGLPPLLLQCATGDRARPEGEELASRARAHGVDVELEIYPADTHVFQAHWPFLPEATDALERAGAFIRRARDIAVDVRERP